MATLKRISEELADRASGSFLSALDASSKTRQPYRDAIKSFIRWVCPLFVSVSIRNHGDRSHNHIEDRIKI